MKWLKESWLLLLFWCVWLLIWLRYRIEIKGIERLDSSKMPRKGGILFLPNHPAEIDPVLLMIVLWKKFRPHPVVVENFYYLKGARFLMKAVGALPMPNMDGATNKWKLGRIDKLFHQISSALRSRENFLIYPAGRLKVTGEEAIGGASFVHSLLKECPDANVVMIRTTGMWGSTFSRGMTGEVPDFGKALLKGLKIVLANGIFFTPRRKVVVEMELAPQDFPYSAARLELNRYLEQWYNRYPTPGPEPLSLVRYYCWSKELPQPVVKATEKKGEAAVAVSPEMEREIFAKIAALARRPATEIKREQHLSNDLGLDSLDMAQLYVFLDERYDITEVQHGELQTVADLLKAGAGYKKEKKNAFEEVASKWPKEGARPDPVFSEGGTIQEVFLHNCDRMQGAIACADALVGPMSYRKLKMAALVLSSKIRQLPGDKVGILLPSSVAAYLVILATLLAKKTPVMLNWTAGTRALDYAAKLCSLQHVISSRRFLNRLDNGDLGTIDDLLLFLEDLREQIPLTQKIRGFMRSFMKAETLMHALGLKEIRPDAPAVILFTSGTEALPKGVPLSHTNILSNERAAFAYINLKATDVMYGVLPPFHSFGFSVTGLVPLLSGLKVYYAPDPNDSHGLANDIYQWRATLFCCAPSFIKALFRVANPKQLASMRLFVSGAEKTPDELFQYVEKLGTAAEMIEGYGITECAPIVTINPPGKPRHGVGVPLKGVELCVIDPETNALLSTKKEGELCIRGPNVFAGYLDDRPSPFVTVQGKSWYRSGDRGYLEEDGALILTGRAKRFVKIGGEMVGLTGLEEELTRLTLEKKWYAPKDDHPFLGVSVREKESDKPLLILITTFDVSKEDVNAALKETGFGRLVKIAEVHKVEQIPLTGTGKIHYRLLDEI